MLLNCLTGTTVTTVLSGDEDAGDNALVRYSLLNIVDGNNTARPNYFSLNSDSGKYINIYSFQNAKYFCLCVKAP